MAAMRKAIPADLPRLIEIACACDVAAQWPVQEYEKMIRGDANGNRILLVVQGDEQVHGFIVGQFTGNEWEIENVAVQPACQRKGLGRQLLCGFLDLARQAEGAQAVFLEVRQSNVAARKLYESMGFVQVGQRKAYYYQPPEDALVFKVSF